MRRRDDPQRAQYTVTCPCGAPVALDARAIGNTLLCRSCKGSIVAAWGRDSRNTQSIPVVVRHVPGPGQPDRPLVPVANRPILKTQILPQTKFFDCVCGERNVLVGTGPGKSVTCHRCDRIHVLQAAEAGAQVEQVEKAESAPTPVAPPKAAAPPPPPPPPPRKVGLGEILCGCGEILPPRTSRTGREFECKACGRKGHVVPGKDEKGLPVIQAVFTFEPAKPAAPSGASSAWTCPCGAPIPAQVVLAGRMTACPSCGREIRVEKGQGALTTMRPVFAEATAVVVAAACPCGAELPVSENLAGKTVSCAACGRALEVVARYGHVRLRELP